MNTRLLAELESKIQAWMDACCEDSDWPCHTVTSDQAVAIMAKAAALVFDASHEGQSFAAREGYVKASMRRPPRSGRTPKRRM